MNISNGGLIAKTNHIYYFADLKDYSGTFAVSESFRIISKLDSLMWFINIEHQQHPRLYYSNQTNNNYIHCFETANQKDTALINVPGFNIVHHISDLFYINENDGSLYKLSLHTLENIKMVMEQVICFVVLEDEIYFSTLNGIKRLHLNTNQVYKVSDDIAICLIVSENKLLYANKANNYTLTLFDILNNERRCFGGVITKSITCKGEYIYAANAENGLSIERISASSGNKIRISGERADKLHLVDNDLFFINKDNHNEWYKINLLDGIAMPAFTGRL